MTDPLPGVDPVAAPGDAPAVDPRAAPAAGARRALVVDDAPEIAALTARVLARDGFAVTTVTTGAAAVAHTAEADVDLIILDLVLADADGLDVCRRIRAATDAYLVVVSTRSAEHDRVQALAVGADDVVAKPFSPFELAARVDAMLRRPRTLSHRSRLRADGSPAVTIVGPLVVDTDARAATWRDQALALTRIEFDLLAALARRSGAVLTRLELLQSVWGPNWYGDTHVVDVHVSNLRRKVSDAGSGAQPIQTVRGVGFRLSL